jgi:hypothetical protein
MAATTLGPFIDALVAALQVRPGLARVNIFGCPVDPEDLGSEGIEFAEEVSIEQAPAAMMSTAKEESYAVSGSILVAAAAAPLSSPVATVNGAAKVARDRCLAIVEEVTDELATNDTMSATVRDAQIVSMDVHQAMAPEAQLGRICWAEFVIAVKARVTP